MQKSFIHRPHACVVRLVTALLACLLFFPLHASGDKKTEKAYLKLCKKEVKQLQADGWKVFGKSQALEEALLAYYMEQANGAQYIHVQQEGRNYNEALNRAKLEAQKSYAEAIESTIRVQVEAELKAAGTDDNAPSDNNFQAKFKQKVDQRVQELEPRLTLTREKKDGHVEVKQYYTYKLTD